MTARREASLGRDFGNAAVVVMTPTALYIVYPHGFVNRPLARAPESTRSLDEVSRNVISRKGRVDPDSARRFLNRIFYGNGPGSLEKLDIEFKLNLYESIAREDNPRNAVYLDALNQEMGLTKEFYLEQAATAAGFMSDENKQWLEQRWKESGRQGTFGDAMAQAIRTPERVGTKGKTSLLGFIAASYSEYADIRAPHLEFIHAHPNLQGETDGRVLRINTNTPDFSGNFLGTFHTLMHELEHNRQRDLAADYKAGRIGRDHKDYIAARVFSANMDNFGYIEPDNAAGFSAYEGQIVEVDANFAGRVATRMARQKYGRVPVDIHRNAQMALTPV